MSLDLRHFPLPVDLEGKDHLSLPSSPAGLPGIPLGLFNPHAGIAQVGTQVSPSFSLALKIDASRFCTLRRDRSLSALYASRKTRLHPRRLSPKDLLRRVPRESPFGPIRNPLSDSWAVLLFPNGGVRLPAAPQEFPTGRVRPFPSIPLWVFPLPRSSPRRPGGLGGSFVRQPEEWAEKDGFFLAGEQPAGDSGLGRTISWTFFGFGRTGVGGTRAFSCFSSTI